MKKYLPDKLQNTLTVFMIYFKSELVFTLVKMIQSSYLRTGQRLVGTSQRKVRTGRRPVGTDQTLVWTGQRPA